MEYLLICFMVRRANQNPTCKLVEEAAQPAAFELTRTSLYLVHISERGWTGKYRTVTSKVSAKHWSHVSINHSTSPWLTDEVS